MTPKERWDAVFKEGKDFTTFNEIFIDEVLLPRLSQMKQKTEPTLLDIGCGKGDLMFKMKKRGFIVSGIDASDEAVRIARELVDESDTAIISGDLDEDALRFFQGKKFNLITMKLVIAFIKDQAGILREINDLLEDDGKFLLITPLIRQEVTYTKPQTKGIAVDAILIETLLKSSFGKFELIHRDFIEDNGVVGYYLCSK